VRYLVVVFQQEKAERGVTMTEQFDRTVRGRLCIDEWARRDLALWYATPNQATPSSEELAQQVIIAFGARFPSLCLAQDAIDLTVSEIKRLAKEVDFFTLARSDRGIGQPR
jgi:hypothetical protein